MAHGEEHCVTEVVAEMDVFKREFKHYRKLTASQVQELINQTVPRSLVKISLPYSSRSSDSSSPPSIVTKSNSVSPHILAASLGLSSPDQWNVYSVPCVPGLIFISDPFLSGHQHRWVKQCLVSYPCKPNICNLDAHVTRPGLGQLWPADNYEKEQIAVSDLQHKLRWVTLGYHHNWDTKHYDVHQRSPFPPDLANLTQFILSVVGFPQFTAEAAIVNYYHLDSTLSGHTDHSERDLNAPLISISFGQSAIFLIGGKTKQDCPVPLVLNSGDVVIMSGESRLAYHALPKVLTPPDKQTRVPDVLSFAALKRAVRTNVEATSTHSSCVVCGQTLQAEASCSNRQTQTKWSSTQTTDHHLSDDVALLESKSHTEDMHVSACSSSSSPVVADRLSQCTGCQWLMKMWPQFELYLSYSRINVNVRQVGDLLNN